jgi:hypothetical protein
MNIGKEVLSFIGTVVPTSKRIILVQSMTKDHLFAKGTRGMGMTRKG